MDSRRLGAVLCIWTAWVLGAAGAATASPSPGLCLPVTGSNGWCGDGLEATLAKLAVPRDVTPLPSGGFLIADSVNHVVRRVDAGGRITTIVGTGTPADPTLGKPARSNHLGTPSAVALLPDGGYLIADAALGEVLRVTPSGVLTGAVGQDAGVTIGDNGPATEAQLQSPRDIALLPDGGYAIADAGADRVRRVLPDGTIQTLAGRGTAGVSGDGGPAALARLSQPTGLAVATDGALLVADRGNARIRRIAPDGTISTIAGGGSGATPALQATLTFPTAVAALPDGAVLVAESDAIRRIEPDGAIATVGGTGRAGFNILTAPATAVALAHPTAIAALPGGGALVADTLNDRVRLLAGDGSTMRTVAGSGVPGPPGTSQPAPPVTLPPPDAPNLSAKIVTTLSPRRQRPSDHGKRAFEMATRSHCSGPGDPDPRRFSDLHLLPMSSSVLTTGRKVKVKFALNRDASLLVKITRSGSGRFVKSRRKKVKAGGSRTLAIEGRVKPGSYRIALQATSSDGLRRCHALRLAVKK